MAESNIDRIIEQLREEVDRERNTPEGKRLIRKTKRKDEKKARRQIRQRKRTKARFILESSLCTGLPTVIMMLVDSYLHVRCESCSSPISPSQLNDWSWSNSDTFSTRNNPCSHSKPHSHVRSSECIMNKVVRVNVLDGGPSWLMHINKTLFD
jgi:hypothetical protein